MAWMPDAADCYYRDDSVALLHGDTLQKLAAIPDGSIQCVITSPPYFGSVRDYGLQPTRWSDGHECCLGHEPCLEHYVRHSMDIYKQVHRILRDDGTFFLNIGEKMLPNKCESFTPHHVAMECVKYGFICRQTIIWSKPSPTPAPTTDRCVPSFEYVFLLTKSQKYFFDHVAIREPFADARQGCDGSKKASERNRGGRTDGLTKPNGIDPSANGGRNKRSVWTIATQPYKGSGDKKHLATFPSRLIEPMIQAGTPEGGCCSTCHKPWRREIETTKITRHRPNDKTDRHHAGPTVNACSNTVAGTEIKTLGWVCTCDCVDFNPAVPSTVLDPFVGSGTTPMVANWLGRHSIGIDLSETYLRDHAMVRIKTPRPKPKPTRRRPKKAAA